MSTSALSRARIRQAAYHDESVPPGTGMDAAGRQTTSARKIYEGGVIGPLADHKGYGLALSTALLCGPLTGSHIGPELSCWLSGGNPKGMGHLFIGISPEAFRPLDEFEEAVQGYCARIKNSRVAEDFTEIRIPGERAVAERLRRLETGIPILCATWSIVEKIAAEHGVQMPRPHP